MNQKSKFLCLLFLIIIISCKSKEDNFEQKILTEFVVNKNDFEKKINYIKINYINNLELNNNSSVFIMKGENKNIKRNIVLDGNMTFQICPDLEIYNIEILKNSNCGYSSFKEIKFYFYKAGLSYQYYLKYNLCGNNIRKNFESQSYKYIYINKYWAIEIIK